LLEMAVMMMLASWMTMESGRVWAVGIWMRESVMIFWNGAVVACVGKTEPVWDWAREGE
jgi:hypothetical protein